MKNEKICGVKNCLLLARWIPHIIVKLSDNDNVFNIEFFTPVCIIHKASLRIQDIVLDKTLIDIQKMFTQSNLTAPTRNNMFLDWHEYTPVGMQVPIYNDIGKLMDKVELSKKIKLEKV